MRWTYAIGDIHGCLDKLLGLVEQCRNHAGADAFGFVFLGDFIDRGSDSRGVLAFLIDLERRSPDDVVCVSGNHEDMALAALSDEQNFEHWRRRNGGDKMLLSYGVKTATEITPAHIEWMRALRTHHDDGLRFFVHAGVNPARPLDDQDAHDLRWIREPFLSDPRDYGRLIVHGHTPIHSGVPDRRANRLNLDTAAVLGGPLTAAIFDDRTAGPAGFLQEF